MPPFRMIRLLWGNKKKIELRGFWMQRLLTNGNAEFRDSTDKKIGYKSLELREVLRSLEFVQRNKCSHNVVPLWRNIQIWKSKHPKETDPKGKRGRLLPQLEREIKELAALMGFDDQLETQEKIVSGHRKDPIIIEGQNIYVVNRHRLLKTVTNSSSSVASTGISVASTATGVTAGSLGKALVVGGTAGLGTAATAAGGLIVLPAAGLAMTVGGMGLAGRSWYKTSKHIHGLEDIERKAEEFECESVLAEDRNALMHREIVTTVLPYILSQKKRKRWRKRAAVTGIGALGVAAHSGARKVKKHLNRTLGHDRADMARKLTEHFITHNCQLCDAVIAELLSEREMETLKYADFTHIYDHVLDKMTST